MRKVLRLMFMVLVGSSLAVMLSLAAAQWIETDTIIYQHVREQVYRISILDTTRNFRLGLAGTRCYSPLPPCCHDAEEMGANAIAYYQEALIHVERIHDDHPADVVKRLRCP